jgi:hypothetical protein
MLQDVRVTRCLEHGFRRVGRAIYRLRRKRINPAPLKTPHSTIEIGSGIALVEGLDETEEVGGS